MYPSGHPPQPPYGYHPQSTAYYGAQYPIQQQYWAQGQSPQAPQTFQYPQPHPAVAAPPPSKPRFPSSKQWRRDDKGGSGKSQYFFSEAPDKKRQKLDPSTQTSPLGQASSMAARPAVTSVPASLPPFSTEPPFASQPLPHTPAPTPPAPWAAPPQPRGWPGPPSASPPYHQPHGYQPLAAYHPGYPAPQPHPGYPPAPPTVYPHGVGYPPASHPAHTAPPSAYHLPPSGAQHFHYLQHQSVTPTQGHWQGRQRDSSLPGYRGRGNHRTPSNRHVSGPPASHVWKQKPGRATADNKTHSKPHVQTSSPHPVPGPNISEQSPPQILDSDDNSWIDCEPDDYWPREEELVPELGLGFVVWRPPQSVSRVMPSTFEAAEQWSNTISQYSKRKSQNSISKYVWEAKLEEHCLPIAVTDEWKEVADDPIFVEFHKKSQLIPMEELINRHAQPIVRSKNVNQFDVQNGKSNVAIPGTLDPASQSYALANAGTKRCASEALDEEDSYVPLPHGSIGSSRGTSQHDRSPTNLTTSALPDEMESKIMIKPLVPHSSTRHIVHDLPKKPEAPLPRPVNASIGRTGTKRGKDHPHNSASLGVVRDQAQEDALARLGVTGSPRPTNANANQSSQATTSRHEVDFVASPKASAAGIQQSQTLQPRLEVQHAHPPPPPPPLPKPQQALSVEVPVESWSRGSQGGDIPNSPGTDVSNHTIAGSDFDESRPVRIEAHASVVGAVELEKQLKSSSDKSPSDHPDQSNAMGSIRKRPRCHADEPEDVRRQEDDTHGRHRKKGPKVNAVYNRRW